MVEIPRPGRKVRGSRSGAPIMALFDLLGRRWCMGVLWTVAEAGPATFSTLEQACDTISPAVLSTRLKELQAARFVARTVDGYAATPLGLRVYRELRPLRETARLWSTHLDQASQQPQPATPGAD